MALKSTHVTLCCSAAEARKPKINHIYAPLCAKDLSRWQWSSPLNEKARYESGPFVEHILSRSISSPDAEGMQGSPAFLHPLWLALDRTEAQELVGQPAVLGQPE